MDLEITKRPTSYNEGRREVRLQYYQYFGCKSISSIGSVNHLGVLMCLMNIQIWPVETFVHWLLFVQIFVIPCVRFWYGYNCESEDPTRGECNIVQQWMVLATNSFYLAIDLHMILVNTILFIHLQGVSKRVHRILLSSRHLACFNENNSENISIQFFCFSWAFLAQSERL